jgi:hypothetical protein
MRSAARVFWLVFSFWFGPSLVVPGDDRPVPGAPFRCNSRDRSREPCRHAGKNRISDKSLVASRCTCLDQGCATAVASPATADVSLYTSCTFYLHHHVDSSRQTCRRIAVSSPSANNRPTSARLNTAGRDHTDLTEFRLS